MKKQTFLLLLLPLLLIISCQPADEKTGDFRLLPLPQKMEITGNSALSVDEIQGYFALDQSEPPALIGLLKPLQPADHKEMAQVIFKIDGSLDLKAEGYTLDISRKQISIVGKDRAGLLYGFMTLGQLMEDAQEQEVPLPTCTIEDYPLLSYRAIHLDVKHHREKTEYYYTLMDKLAGYKVNAIIAEMEDKLVYEGQPAVGSADALSIEEWRNLSEYAMERNIEISPLIQGLGHASFILKHEIYKGVRDDPASDWAFNPLASGTYKVQFDLYRDALEATPHGRYLHVGGDEVHTTGRGSGKSPLELQLIWLDKVCKFAEENGRIPIFWDDMPLKHAGVYWPMFNPDLEKEVVDSIWQQNENNLAQFLDRFPRNCVYMRWNYSDPEAYGNDKAMEWFMAHELQVMGATAGQTRWVLMPQEESNMENIRTFTVTSIDKGLNGLLLTLWDDDSPHFELYMRGIIAFAEYSWSGDQREKDAIKSAFRQREFSYRVAGEEFAFIDRLEGPVEWWNNALLMDHQDRRSLVKLPHPLEDAVMDLPDADHRGIWSAHHAERLQMAEKVVQECDSIAAKISAVKSNASRNIYRIEVYEQVNNLVRFSAASLLALKAYDSAQNEAEAQDALDRIGKLHEEFSNLRGTLEQVYGKTRILNKPDGYMLDQDHHEHLANQAVSFDWQFIAELLFLEKIDRDLKVSPE